MATTTTCDHCGEAIDRAAMVKVWVSRSIRVTTEQKHDRILELHPTCYDETLAPTIDGIGA